MTARVTGYCPACYALLEGDARTCPVCGADLSRLSEREYREKLIVALRHPLADVRLRAIIALGWRQDAIAADALAECTLSHPTDVIEGLEVVESLRLIHQPSACHALARIARQHAARAIRAAAQRAAGECG